MSFVNQFQPLPSYESEMAIDTGRTAGVPGRVPVTARLVARSVNQIILRVGDAAAARELAGMFGPRDANGVMAGAEVAVERAASSAGQPLRGDVRERFESSLGADLSGVRVHTGAESAQATGAVGARAYATGNDIHFADGAYQPDDPFGLHLLAHEVAHTVQQQGAAPTRQHKLEVSGPSDSAELEADRAADAMVRGEAATVSGGGGGLARKGNATPSNSYNQGDLAWENGTALTEEEAQAWHGKHAGLLGAVGLLAAKGAAWAGISVPSLSEALAGKKIEKIVTEVDADVALIDANLKHLQTQIDYLREKDKRTDKEEQQLATYCGQIVEEEEVKKKKLTRKTEAPKTLRQEALGTVGSAAKGLSEMSTIAGGFNGVTQTVNPSIFKDINDGAGKVEAAISGINFLCDMMDRTEYNAFEKNPNLDTAEAWGNKVGGLFAQASGLASLMPEPIAAVYEGVLQTPQRVITAFAGVVRSYYAKVDHETKDGCHGKSELLEPGASSTCKNTH
jgi:hypothetical protein